MDEDLTIAQRNSFFESLPAEAKERFLGALQAAKDRGLDDTIAWREAVIAAETAYSPERPMVPSSGTVLADDVTNL